MARNAIDISVTGDAELLSLFSRLQEKDAKRITRKGLREATRGLYRRVLSAVPVRTGALLRAMSDEKATVKSFTGRRKSWFGYWVQFPTRQALGIPADYQWYYPAIIEYGTKDGRIPPNPFLRHATDEERPQAIQTIRRVIGDEIVKLVKRATRKSFRSFKRGTRTIAQIRRGA